MFVRKYYNNVFMLQLRENSLLLHQNGIMRYKNEPQTQGHINDIWGTMSRKSGKAYCVHEMGIVMVW